MPTHPSQQRVGRGRVWSGVRPGPSGEVGGRGGCSGGAPPGVTGPPRNRRPPVLAHSLRSPAVSLSHTTKQELATALSPGVSLERQRGGVPRAWEGPPPTCQLGALCLGVGWVGWGRAAVGASRGAAGIPGPEKLHPQIYSRSVPWASRARVRKGVDSTEAGAHPSLGTSLTTAPRAPHPCRVKSGSKRWLARPQAAPHGGAGRCQARPLGPPAPP